MACMKDKDAWFIVECLTCPKVMDCIKLDWADDPKVKEGIVSYLRELYGIDDHFPFLKDSEERLTILNFGELDLSGEEVIARDKLISVYKEFIEKDPGRTEEFRKFVEEKGIQIH